MCSSIGRRGTGETDPLAATLPMGQATEEEYVPVQFRAPCGVGRFELWCEHMSDQRWKLEFSVREDAEEVPEAQETPVQEASRFVGYDLDDELGGLLY